MLLVASILAAGAWFFGQEPLEEVPRQLLGRWQPRSPDHAGLFLRIDGAALEWSAGPGRVERRELLGARRVDDPPGGEVYALHFLQEGKVDVLRLELAADGSARVGGRRSVEWSRTAASP